jgi:hypothetical protein
MGLPVKGCTVWFEFLNLVRKADSNLDKSPGAGLNRRPRPYQGRALPTELPGHTSRWLVAYDSIRQMEMLSGHLLSAITVIKQIGAGNGTRTRDPELGRLALYQLSYSRKQNWWRGKDSNLRRHSRQIYSLLPLATREPLLFSLNTALSLALPTSNRRYLCFSTKTTLLPGAGDRT